MSRIAATVLVALVLATAAAAQGPFKAFVSPEGTALVAPSPGGEPSMNMPGRPPGMIGMRNVALRDIIGYAYGLPSSPQVNAPDWTSTDRFDIGAKVPADAAPAQTIVLVQRLLEERFKLRVHREVQAGADVLVIDQIERPSEY